MSLVLAFGCAPQYIPKDGAASSLLTTNTNPITNDETFYPHASPNVSSAPTLTFGASSVVVGQSISYRVNGLPGHTYDLYVDHLGHFDSGQHSVDARVSSNNDLAPGTYNGRFYANAGEGGVAQFTLHDPVSGKDVTQSLFISRPPSIHAHASCFISESMTLDSLTIGDGVEVTFGSSGASPFDPECVVTPAPSGSPSPTINFPASPAPVPSQVPNLATFSAEDAGLDILDQSVPSGGSVVFDEPKYGADDLAPRKFISFHGGFLPVKITNLVIPDGFDVVKNDLVTHAKNDTAILNQGQALDLEVLMKIDSEGNKSGALTFTATIEDTGQGNPWTKDYSLSLSGHVPAVIRAKFDQMNLTVPYTQHKGTVGVTLTRALDFPVTLFLHVKASNRDDEVLPKVTIPAGTTHVDVEFPIYYDCGRVFYNEQTVTMQTGFIDAPPVLKIEWTHPTGNQTCTPGPSPTPSPSPTLPTDEPCIPEEGAAKPSYSTNCLAFRAWILGFPVPTDLISQAKLDRFTPTNIGPQYVGVYSDAANIYIKRREKWNHRWFGALRSSSESLLHLVSMGYLAQQSNLNAGEDKEMEDLEKEVFGALTASTLPASMKKDIKKNLLRLNMKMASAEAKEADWVAKAAKEAKTTASVVLTVDLIVAAIVIPVAAPEIVIALKGTGAVVFAGKVGFATLASATVINAVDTTKLALKAEFAGDVDKSFYENLKTQFNETTDARYTNVAIGAAMAAGISAGGGFLAPLCAGSNVMAQILQFSGRVGVPAMLTALGGLQAVGSCAHIVNLNRDFDATQDMDARFEIQKQLRGSYIDCGGDIFNTALGAFATVKSAKNPLLGTAEITPPKLPSMACYGGSCRAPNALLYEGLVGKTNLDLMQLLFNNETAQDFIDTHGTFMTLMQLRRDAATILSIRAAGNLRPGQPLALESLAWEAELLGLKVKKVDTVYRQSNQAPSNAKSAGMFPNTAKPQMMLGEHVRYGSTGGSNLVSTSLLPAENRIPMHGEFLTERGIPLDAADFARPEIAPFRALLPASAFEKTYDYMIKDAWGVDTRSINEHWYRETEFTTNFIDPSQIQAVRPIFRITVPGMGERVIIPPTFGPVE